MTEIQLDSLDQKLVNRLQVKFPLVSKPYACIGEDLSITENEVIQRIAKLRTEGIIRQIGPLLDAKKIDYKTTLVAMRVTGADLNKAAGLLADYPVSHAYEREHYFNLWITLALPGISDIDKEMAKIANLLNAEACISLPAMKLFKLRVYFNSGGDEQPEIADSTGVVSCNTLTTLSDDERKVINEIQQDLPLASHPFRGMAANLGMTEEEFLDHCNSLLSRGVIRRFSIAVNHHNVGFNANGMACWIVPADKVDAAGQGLASMKEVSHCYERKTNDLWHYNLFAMCHGDTQDHCRTLMNDASQKLGLPEPLVLFSTREIKKMRVKYRV